MFKVIDINEMSCQYKNMPKPDAKRKQRRCGERAVWLILWDARHIEPLLVCQKHLEILNYYNRALNK